MWVRNFFVVTIVRLKDDGKPKVATELFLDCASAQKYMKSFCEGLESPYWAEVKEDPSDYAPFTMYPIKKNGTVVGYLRSALVSLDDFPSFNHNDFEYYKRYKALDLLGYSYTGHGDEEEEGS